MSFSPFVLGGLINDFEYTKKVLPYLKEDWFESKAEKIIFNEVKEYIDKYSNSPTLEAVAIGLADKTMEEGLYDNVMSGLSEIEYNPLNETQWLVDKTEEFCKERAIFLAMTKSISIMDGEDKKLDKNSIPDLLTQALAVSFDSSIGHDYYDDAESQYEYYHADDTRIPFKLNVFNKITRGGVKNKTLNILCSGINVGKSTGLIDLAASYMEDGLDVVYFSMEMDEPTVRSRVDVRLLEMTSDQIESLSKDSYLSKVHALKSKSYGKLIVKEFPTGIANINHFRHALNEMKLKKSITPRVLLVDYMGIMSSAKLPANAKGNSDTYYTSVAEELRSLAQEFNVPCWSAWQLNREGQDGNRESKMGDLAKAIGVAATADYMVVFTVPDELIPLKQAIGKVIKNRYKNRNAISKFIIGLDNDLQKFYDVSETHQSNVMDQSELSQLKETIDKATGEITNKKPVPQMDWEF